METFLVPIKVRNWQNRFLPPQKQGEDVSCDAVEASESARPTAAGTSTVSSA